jgi:hypothetical protein
MKVTITIRTTIQVLDNVKNPLAARSVRRKVASHRNTLIKSKLRKRPALEPETKADLKAILVKDSIPHTVSILPNSKV